MSDQPTTPDDQKPSREAPEPLPKHQQMTFGQHLFVWTMVLVVGVLFGIGSNFTDMMGPTHSVSGVDQTELLVRQRVARKLQDALNPRRIPAWYGGGEMFELQSSEQYAEQILLARQARKEGLMPDGKALDAIVSEFLNRDDRAANRRYADILNDLGGDRRVTEMDLRLYLAERQAVEMLHQTHVTTPAVPLAVAGPLTAMRDQIEVDEVVIDARPVLPEVKRDDPEIQTTYDRLRNERFRRAAARIIDVVVADQQKISDAVVIAEADLAKYYEEHKEQYRKPEPPKPEAGKDEKKDDKKDEKKEAPKPEYKALAEVSGEIRDILRRERSEAKIKELFDGFEKGLTDDTVETLDLAALKERAAKAGLLVKEALVIEEPDKGGAYQIPDVGEVEVSQVNLFNQELNFVSNVIQAKNGGARAVLRIAGKRDAGFRELSDPAVAKEVTAAVAGKRAYKDFLKAMEDLRANAEKLGPGGLRKALAGEAALKWDAAKKVATSTKRIIGQQGLVEYRAPAADLGGPAGDARLLVSLIMPNRPVILADEPASEGVPQIRLVQAVALKEEKPPADGERNRQADQYRALLDRYRGTLYQMELSNRIARN